MRRKVISIVILLAAIGIIVSMVACVPTPPPGPNGNNTQIVAIIPDLIDYGAATYLIVPKAVYDAGVKNTQIDKLATKQVESREDYLNGETAWDNTHYYPFDKPHFDEDNVWIEDDATTVTKVFCYSTPEDIIERMAEAGLDQEKMVDLVAYITRSDDAYDEFEKGDLDKYPLTLGEGSAIHDYDNLDEISDIRDNFDDYKTTDGDSDPLTAYGQTEDFWEDLAKLKKRKIYGEIFLIFLEEADKFARFQTEYVTYQLQVVNDVMIPAFKNEYPEFDLGSETEGENLIDSDQFKNYMREELFDFEMLSYFLAFADLTGPEIESGYWQAVDRAKVMTLYGYTYQYEKNNHEVFDDTVLVQNGKTEYEDYLYLGHRDYFMNNDPNTFGDTHAQAIRYTEYDRRNYREAYRYSAAFYVKYYSAQYEFQSLQEARDREVFTDSIEYTDGIGFATNSELTYTDEMIDGLALGFAETLKLSDVNYEYTDDEGNVTRYNAKNTAWNSLTDAQKNLIGVNALKEVELQIQQLTSQQYTINHETITATDLVKFMQYQIKSYSADYIRAIQDNKKEQVVERRRLQRAYQFFESNYAPYTEVLAEFSTYNAETYEETVVEEKIENLGRAKAMAVNLNANYSGTDIDGQIAQASSANWKGEDGIASNIDATLAINYVTWNTNQKASGGNYYVDEYFEDNLIKRVYDCGGADVDHCGLPLEDQVQVHMYLDTNGDLVGCEKIYDSEWALSRLLNAHEDVLRHMAGQTQISFMKLNADQFSDYYDETKGWASTEYLSTELQKTSKRKIVNSKPYEKDTVESGDEIGTLVEVLVSGSLYKPNFMPPYPVEGIILTSGVSEKNRAYHTTANCRYDFDAWCVDEDLMYEVDPTEKVRFDIKLYPRYKVTNVTAPGN